MLKLKNKKNKVLYIEDEVDACSTMVEFLKPRGFKTVVSFTAEEAYDLMKGFVPDIILIDIRLIGQSGISFIERIQAEGVKTPIIIISAFSELIEEMKLKRLKICGYFEKPYSYADLFRAIKKCLGKNKDG